MRQPHWNSMQIVPPQSGQPLTNQSRSTQQRTSPSRSSRSRAIGVLLVDDHEVVRDTIAALLGTVEGIEVVGSCADADSALRSVVKHEPDVVLMDVEMPGLLCYEAVRRIHANHPGTRVVLLSGYEDDRNIASAIESGAMGYLTKDLAVDRVVEAIRSVAHGEPWFSSRPETPSPQPTPIERNAPAEAAELDRLGTLTERELEVLRYVARGLRKKDVAETMHLSVKTIDNHTTRVMSKLGVHDRVDLARLAIRVGLVQP